MTAIDLKKAEDNVDENLKVLRTIYAVLYVVGFREVLINIDFGHGILAALPPAFLGSAIALVFLAIRMFWGVGNIRRDVGHLFSKYSVEHQTTDPESISRDVFGGWPGIRIMLVDVPALLMHSFLFYILCKLQPAMLLGGPQVAPARDFLFVLCSLLLLNALWLGALKIRGSAVPPQSFWFWNNIIFACIGFTVWLLSSPSFGTCWADAGQVVLWIAVAISLANSLIDLRFTAWAYLIGAPG
jgi:hypothetical protein